MTSTLSRAPARGVAGLPAIAVLSLCTFLICLTVLAWNLSAGHDPALAGSAPPAQVAKHPKHHAAPVLVTRTSGGGIVR
jgi:hypothetical protein